jgi:hypothetical protein
MLARGADDHDRARQPAGQPKARQGDTGADRRVCDDIVPTAVAHLGQDIVLGDNRHPRARATAGEPRQEGGGHPRDAALDLSAELGQQLGEPLGRLVLLQPDLGVVGHPVAGRDQSRCDPLDLTARCCLQRRRIHGFLIRHTISAVLPRRSRSSTASCQSR